MWTSTLPTGTVRDEGYGRRTFPKQSASSGHVSDHPRLTASPRQNHPPQQSQHDHGSRPTVARQAEIERLRAENRQALAEIKQLEAQLDRLQTQLAHHEQTKQAIVDQYEHVIAELERAATTAPASTTNSADVNRTHTTEYGLVTRLKRWVSTS